MESSKKQSTASKAQNTDSPYKYEGTEDEEDCSKLHRDGNLHEKTPEETFEAQCQPVKFGIVSQEEAVILSRLCALCQ